MVTPNSVVQIGKWLERAGEKAVEWGENNHVEFDNAKNEAIAFRRKRKLKLNRRIAEAKITIRGHIMLFNTESTR